MPTPIATPATNGAAVTAAPPIAVPTAPALDAIPLMSAATVDPTEVIAVPLSRVTTEEP